MERNEVYTLNEIANWQKNGEVSLPTIQRGFVWRPFQIENLWDSILRGYPLGAFVFAVNDHKALELLDGQQRSTAISLGFGNDTFRHSIKSYRVFIDLIEPEPDDERKFIIRVITRSHPWGYNKTNNSKTLSVEAIRNAMNNNYGDADPLSSDLDDFFPADAKIPVPLSFFLNAALEGKNNNELLRTIFDWKHWETVKRNWIAGKNIHESELIQDISNRIIRIYLAANKSLKNQKVPALYLNLNDQIENNTENSNDEAADEIETMFVRLNAGGTPLTGEELNYSILKAHISLDTQEKIEEGCKLLFKPSRFITIAYRLYQHEDKENRKGDALAMRIKPKQFQKNIISENKAKEFEEYLTQVLCDRNYDNVTLLEYVKNILSYSTEKPYALPYLLYSKVSDVAPELMFLLLYRIKNKGDRFKSGEHIHRKALGMLCLMLWTGRGISNKDHSKLLQNIWSLAESESKINFWSSNTIQRGRIDDNLIAFPNLDGEQGVRKITGYKINEDHNVIGKYSKTPYEQFIWKALYNKDLLLFAQRSFLESFFKTAQYQLDDTNLPFDWDHISAYNLIKNKKNIPKALKNCYQMIGNFRAWPYALNRMDSDNSPARKLKPLTKEFHSEKLLEDEKQKWLSFIKKHTEVINDVSELHEKLSDWSFCNNDWSNCEITNIKTDWKKIVKLVMSRNLKVLEHWYHEHLIEELIPFEGFTIEDILNKQRWKILSKDNHRIINEIFDLEEDVNWVSSAINLGTHKVNLYIYYARTNNKFNLLRTGEFKFGIFDEKKSLIRLSDKTQNYYVGEEFLWIETHLTLSSHASNSYKIMISEIKSWIKDLSFPQEIEKDLLNYLQASFSQKKL